MHLWDTGTGKEIALTVAPVLDTELCTTDFRSDGQACLISTQNKLYQFNPKGQCIGIAPFFGNRGPWDRDTARYVNGGMHILAQTRDPSDRNLSAFVLLNAQTMAEVTRFGLGRHIVRTTVSEDGKRVVVARTQPLEAQSTIIQVWDLDKLTAPVLEFKSDDVAQLCLSPDKSKLYFNSGSNYSAVADLDHGGRQMWKRQGFHGQAAFLPSDNALLLCADEPTELQFCDPRNGEELEAFPCKAGAFRLSSDRQSLAVFEDSKTVVIWRRGRWLWLRISLLAITAICTLSSVMIWNRSRANLLLQVSPTISKPDSPANSSSTSV
jgi:hypothetical protein